MEKWGEVLEFSEPVPPCSAPDTSAMFTRWSAAGVRRSPATSTMSGDATGAYDRWAAVLSDDVTSVRAMVVEQERLAKRASTMYTHSPMCVSTPNLSALVKDDGFELPKATMMLGSLLAYDMR